MNEPKKKILLTAQANEFIYAQPLPVIGEFLATLRELETHGNLGLPRAKKIDDNLFEIRIKVARNQEDPEDPGAHLGGGRGGSRGPSAMAW